MIWEIFFILSLATVIVTLMFAFWRTKKRKTFSRRMSILFFGFFFAVLFLFLPIYFFDVGHAPLAGLKAFLMAFNRTVRAFTLTDINFMQESFRPAVGIYDVYSGYMTLLCFVCPFLSVGYILSFFKKARASMGFALSFFRDIYVFSDLNENALTLAEDIFEHHPGARIVFMKVTDSARAALPALAERAERIGAVCFSRDVLSVNFFRHSRAAEIWFFCMSEDAGENTSDALSLISRYKTRPKTNLYVFSTDAESGMSLCGVEKGVMKVRRVDEVLAMTNAFFYEKGQMIFETARPLQNGEKPISAVVVGLGKCGTEVLKTLAWYCQMDGYRLKIDAFDRDPLAREMFAAQCPELMSEERNGVDADGEAFYDISVHAGADVRTAAFSDEIKALKDATFVFVALGSDSLNISAAAQLRMLFERSGADPAIVAVLHDSEKKAALQNAKNFRGDSYRLTFIGDRKSVFSEKAVINSEVESEALKVHLRWGKEEDFWNYEYNYRSSAASAIHRKARAFCAIPGAVKEPSALTDDERESLAVLEHKRWNAYVRSQGYVFSGSGEKESRSDLAKVHPDLVGYSLLDEKEREKDRRVSAD